MERRATLDQAATGSAYGRGSVPHPVIPVFAGRGGTELERKDLPELTHFFAAERPGSKRVQEADGNWPEASLEI